MRIISFFACLMCIISCSTDTSIQEPVVNVFEGDVELFTQQAVEDFGAMAYTEITGNLILSAQFENPDPIFSLSNLSTLEVVGGDLKLNALYNVSTLDGLQNLNSVSGVVSLSVNSLITSLDAFSNIQSTIQGLEIIRFREIETLQGLDNITITSGGVLNIEGNDKLVNLDAIQEGLPSVMATIRFQEIIPDCGPLITCGSMPSYFQPFTSLTFLSNVTEVEWLRIRGFQGTNLSGLENITSVNRLTIWRTPNITNLQELNNITSDIFSLSVFENDQLETLSGLENISSITNAFRITFNPVLTDFCSVQNSISNISNEENAFLINGNAFNPTMQDIIDGNCSN